MRSVAEEYQLVLEEGMILIHEAGQRYGLIGCSVMVGKTLSGFACTNNMVRVTPNDPMDGGYLFAVLSSPFGVRLIKREAAGSSIPHLDVTRVRSVSIPWPSRAVRSVIGELMSLARDCWDKAVALEDQALALLGSALTDKAFRG